MKKLNNKKGFTIVELVIVIAVIGILAAVLIPTFSGVIDKANESSRVQQTENALKSLIVNLNGELKADATYYFCIDQKVYKYDGGKIDFDTPATLPAKADDKTIVVYSKTEEAADVHKLLPGSNLAYITETNNSNKKEFKLADGVTIKAVTDFSKNVVVVEVTPTQQTNNTQS